MHLADRPLVQFAAYFAIGALVMMAVVWMDAVGSLTLPHWFPQEGIVFAIGCAFVAFAAAWRTQLAAWRDMLAATLVATGLHLAIYLLPLTVLLSAPLGAILVFGAPLAFAVFLLYGVCIVAATWLRMRHWLGGPS